MSNPHGGDVLMQLSGCLSHHRQGAVIANLGMERPSQVHACLS